MGNRHAKAVILVEDDASMAQALSRNLQLAGLDVVAHRSAETLLEAGLDEGVLCMIIDIHLPGIDAFALLDRLSARGGVPPAIVITAFDSPGARAQAAKAGVAAFLRKPFARHALLDAIDGIRSHGSAS
jgi:FixJ family two-component response regulator